MSCGGHFSQTPRGGAWAQGASEFVFWSAGKKMGPQARDFLLLSTGQGAPHTGCGVAGELSPGGPAHLLSLPLPIPSLSSPCTPIPVYAMLMLCSSERYQKTQETDWGGPGVTGVGQG